MCRLSNQDSQVIALGYERLVLIFIAYCFSMLYEVMSDYLRGFGISLVPAVLILAALLIYHPARRNKQLRNYV